MKLLIRHRFGEAASYLGLHSLSWRSIGWLVGFYGTAAQYRLLLSARAGLVGSYSTGFK